MGRQLKPVLSVELVRLDGVVLRATPAIIDSGADCTTLPIEWAGKLGIDPEADCVEVPCITAAGEGTQLAYPDGIEAVILGERLPLSATFNPGLDCVLLGRRDFFDWYRVLFDQRSKSFTLDPYPERPGDLDGTTKAVSG